MLTALFSIASWLPPSEAARQVIFILDWQPDFGSSFFHLQVPLLSFPTPLMFLFLILFLHVYG
jgi:hypothetical protein